MIRLPRPRCVCGREMVQPSFNEDRYACARCGVSVDAITLLASGADPYELMLQSIRHWWRVNGVSL